MVPPGGNCHLAGSYSSSGGSGWLSRLCRRLQGHGSPPAATQKPPTQRHSQLHSCLEPALPKYLLVLGEC